MSLIFRGPGRAVLVDLAVSAVMAGVPVWWWHQFRLGGLIYGVLLGVALLWRRRRPLLVLALVFALVAVAAPVRVDGTGLHEGMLLLSVAVAVHAVIAHAASLRVAVAGALVGLLGAALVVEGRSSYAEGWSLIFGMVDLLAPAAVVWAAGVSVRVFRQQRVSAAERRENAERERVQLARIAVAEERAEIARELHDIVAHSLSVMVLQANGGEYAFDHEPERARQALRTIGATGRDALDEVKHLVEFLRADGGGPVLEPATLKQLTTLAGQSRAAGLTVDLVVDGTPPEVPGGVALAVYRIVQESLTNTLKHAGPDPVATVRVTYRPEAIEVEVTDSGVNRNAPSPGGHGLVGMRERVALHGGTFDAGPSLGGGWRVRASIPAAAERPAAERPADERTVPA
jgi:signal transduction histidine kinase